MILEATTRDAIRDILDNIGIKQKTFTARYGISETRFSSAISSGNPRSTPIPLLQIILGALEEEIALRRTLSTPSDAKLVDELFVRVKTTLEPAILAHMAKLESRKKPGRGKTAQSTAQKPRRPEAKAPETEFQDTEEVKTVKHGARRPLPYQKTPPIKVTPKVLDRFDVFEATHTEPVAYKPEPDSPSVSWRKNVGEVIRRIRDVQKIEKFTRDMPWCRLRENWAAIERGNPKIDIILVMKAIDEVLMPFASREPKGLRKTLARLRDHLPLKPA